MFLTKGLKRIIEALLFLIFLELFPYKKRKIADHGCVMPWIPPGAMKDTKH
jgi:hypothetical protein